MLLKALNVERRSEKCEWVSVCVCDRKINWERNGEQKKEMNEIRGAQRAQCSFSGEIVKNAAGGNHVSDFELRLRSLWDDFFLSLALKRLSGKRNKVDETIACWLYCPVHKDRLGWLLLGLSRFVFLIM